MDDDEIIDRLKMEVIALKKAQYDLCVDLLNLPEIPKISTLKMLRHASMNWFQGNGEKADLLEIGKGLQQNAEIPHKCEYECSAGLWSLIASGLKQKRKDNEITDS
jgi:hypothetical protein